MTPAPSVNPLPEGQVRFLVSTVFVVRVAPHVTPGAEPRTGAAAPADATVPPVSSTTTAPAVVSRRVSARIDAFMSIPFPLERHPTASPERSIAGSLGTGKGESYTHWDHSGRGK
ncbi:hypothetical protein GCM10009818_03120 [Nakamurella flavida]